MKIRVMVLTVLASLAAFSVCSAEPLRTGPYMSGFLGANFIEETGVTGEQFFPSYVPYNDKVEFDAGINAGMTGGYNFGFFRLEGELAYKGGEISEITDQFTNYPYRSVDGDIGLFAMLVNGFFDLRNGSPVTPYFGGGVGFATAWMGDTYATNTSGGLTTRDHLYLDDTATAFAWQVGGGIEIALNRVLSLDLGYRYFGTAKLEFDGDDDYYYDDFDYLLNNRTEFNYRSHNVSLGFRLKF